MKLECLLGRDPGQEETEVLQVVQLDAVSEDGDCTEFEIDFIPQIAGMQYYRLRMYPFNDAMSHPFELGCMIWI